MKKVDLQTKVILLKKENRKLKKRVKAVEYKLSEATEKLSSLSREFTNLMYIENGGLFSLASKFQKLEAKVNNQD